MVLYRKSVGEIFKIPKASPEISKVKKSLALRCRLLAIFDVAEHWFRQTNFFGCLFINAIGEYSATDTPIRQVCMEYKRLLKGYIRGLCEQAGADNAEKLAEEIALLLEGATVTAQVSQQPKAAQVAKGVAKALVEKAI